MTYMAFSNAFRVRDDQTEAHRRGTHFLREVGCGLGLATAQDPVGDGECRAREGEHTHYAEQQPCDCDAKARDQNTPVLPRFTRILVV